MKHNNTKLFIASLIASSLFLGCDGESVAEDNKAKAALGEQIFLSQAFSKDGTMSCATCHDIDHAMIDSRPTSISDGASKGDDQHSIGDRNAPTASYAMFAPSFHFDEGEGLYIGGQFLDGNAKDLKAQAKGPFLNPVEMNMPNAAAVVSVAENNSTLKSQLMKIYGDDVFKDTDTAYDAIADSVAMFERTEQFAPFDSKFDKVAEGKASFTSLEKEGKVLFEGKALCVACHPINGHHPLMTDFSYDNLGVPENTTLRGQNHVVGPDNGLGAFVNEKGLNGAFKVSSLRNIAVTGPYMHNGLFKDLKTVVHFYNTRDINGINPETHVTWERAEVANTVNHTELGDLGLTNHEEDAIVAFMKTFTDKKFEHLIP